MQLLFSVKLLLLPLPRVTEEMTSGKSPVLVTVVDSREPALGKTSAPLFTDSLLTKPHIGYIDVAGSIQRDGGGSDESGYRQLAGLASVPIRHHQDACPALVDG